MALRADDLENLGRTTLLDLDKEVARTNAATGLNLQPFAQRLESKREQLRAVAMTKVDPDP